MSEIAENAYWPNQMSLFRVTYWVYYEFLSYLFGKNTTKWNMSGPVCRPRIFGFVENDVLKTQYA